MVAKPLLSDVTTQASGAAIPISNPTKCSIQADVAGTGAVSATVVIEGSHDGSNWVTIATISLSGDGSDVDGFWEDLAWPQIRGRVSAISGTGATVNATLAV